MRIYPKALFLLLTVALTGCATKVTMTGKGYPAVNPSQVKVLFKDKPKCDYEELGFISTPLAWDQNAAIEKARAKAAEFGADYIVIESIQKNAYNDASASAIAYKCGTVDRENVDIRAK